VGWELLCLGLEEAIVARNCRSSLVFLGGVKESMLGITGEFVDKARLELAFVEVCKVTGEVQ
jgi:hypothetical protein